MFVFLVVLSMSLLSSGTAFASSVEFSGVALVGAGLAIAEPFQADAGTPTSPDTVTLRASAVLSEFKFNLNVTGNGFPANGNCRLEWFDGIEAPAASSVSCQGGAFSALQSFVVTKAALGIGNGGTQTQDYRLKVTPQNYSGDDMNAERCLRVTFIADDTAQPSLVVDPVLMDGSVKIAFSREVQVSSSTGGTISNMTVSPSGWNGLTLKRSTSDNTITITGTPQSVGNQTFTVSGSVGGVPVSSATFTIRIADLSGYALRADPSGVAFTTNADAVEYIDISSPSGITPMNLSVDVTSWNGLSISVSNSSHRVTVAGTPNTIGSQTVSVSGTLDGQAAVPASFVIKVSGSGGDDDDSDGGGTCNAGMGAWFALIALPLFLRRKR